MTLIQFQCVVHQEMVPLTQAGMTMMMNLISLDLVNTEIIFKSKSVYCEVIHNYYAFYLCLTEELADALLADEMRKSKVTSIQTQAQVHSPISASGRGQEELHAPVSGDGGIAEGSAELSGAGMEKIQHQLAVTTQELMETKEALDKSEKKLLEMQEKSEATGKDDNILNI